MAPTRNPLKSHKGVSLIEVLVAVVIIAIGCIGLYQMFTYGVELLGEQEHRLKAISLVQRRMEYLKNEIDAKFPIKRDTKEQVVIVERGRGQYDDVKGSLTVKAKPAGHEYSGGNPSYNDVHIKLTWTEKSGRSYTVEMRSYLIPRQG